MSEADIMDDILKISALNVLANVRKILIKKQLNGVREK